MKNYNNFNAENHFLWFTQIFASFRFGKIVVLSLLSCLFIPLFSYGQGGFESSASNRGRYLTGLGYIYQAEEIQIDALISKEDFNYPLPQKLPLNITADSDIRGNTGFIQIGLKGKKGKFENMEPMNICFVIDISGSMAGADKLSWVKNAFYVFVKQVRENDIVSVVVFDDVAEVLIEPTSIKNEKDRNEFKRKVDALKPRGSTDIFKGMNLGYTQVEKKYRKDYVNRVLLLTDGMHNGTGTKDDIINVTKKYNTKGINISTIALGAEADMNLVVEMAINGGGSSRFISDHDKMEESFGSELDRLVAPAARMLKMELILSDGVQFAETWGYQNWHKDNSIHYSLETLHNGDYETLFAIVNFDKILETQTKIATFKITYEDIKGEIYQKETDVYLNAENLCDRNNLNNPRIKQAEGYVAYGKLLIELSNLSNSILKDMNYHNSSTSESERPIGSLNKGMDMIESMIKYLKDINLVLGIDEYQDELTTLNNYKQQFDRAI